jgi:hypothetical protein
LIWLFPANWDRIRIRCTHRSADPRRIVRRFFAVLTRNKAFPMSDQPNLARRNMIIGTTVAGGVAGVAAAVYPFASSMTPSDRAKAAGAPVEVDISRLEPGQKIDVEWQGKVVWVVKRTQEMIESVA